MAEKEVVFETVNSFDKAKAIDNYFVGDFKDHVEFKPIIGDKPGDVFLPVEPPEKIIGNPGDVKFPVEPPGKIIRNPGDVFLPVEPRPGMPRPIGPSPIGPGIGAGLIVSISDVEEIIPKLRSVSEQLKTSWSSTLNSTISKLENSWAGDDAKVYIERVKSMDPQVDKVCQAIDLLAQSYQKVLDNSRDKTLIVKDAISRVTF